MLVTQHLFTSAVRVGFNSRAHVPTLRKTLLRSTNKPDRDLLGELGARDPFPAEVESNFGDRVLGYSNTDHLIKPPDEMEKVIGLKSKKCVPCEGQSLRLISHLPVFLGGVPPLSETEIERLRNQVPGWRVIKADDGMSRIRAEWKVRNFKSGLELFERIGAIAESEKHHPDLHLVSYNQVAAELHTHSIGGLTENDFIVAAKINDLEISDLLSKKKTQFWA